MKGTVNAETRIAIRPALSSDKARVLEFCKNTWPGGDYIPKVWDGWIRGPTGSFVVAAVRRVPVGLGHVYLQTKKVAWLEGLRVDPAYRRRGIAGRINMALTRYAVGKGAEVARLCTGVENIASQRHAEKVGFKILQRFERLDCAKALQRKPANVSELHKYQPELWKFVRLQKEFQEFSGLYSDGWTWYPITPQSLRHAANHSGLLATLSSGQPSSVAVVSSDDVRLTLGFLAGDKSQAERMARYSRYILARRRLRRVRALLPHGSSLVATFKTAGFKRTNSILVYEKELGPIRKKG